MRKEKIVRAPSFCGRDFEKRKLFYIREWPAAQAEKWAIRAVLSINRTGSVQIPMNWAGVGWEGLATLGINAFLGGGMKADEVIPVLDELLDCVWMIRDEKAIDKATGKPVLSRMVSDDDVEEIVTRGWLRSEVFELHSGFSPAAALSSWFSMVKSRRPEASESTRTSEENSDSSSAETPAS